MVLTLHAHSVARCSRANFCNSALRHCKPNNQTGQQTNNQPVNSSDGHDICSETLCTQQTALPGNAFRITEAPLSYPQNNVACGNNAKNSQGKQGQ